MSDKRIVVKITKIDKGSQAEIQGLKKNDVILTFNGVHILSSDSLSEEISKTEQNANVVIRVKRNREILVLNVIPTCLGMNYQDSKKNLDDREYAMYSVNSCYKSATKLSEIILLISAVLIIVGLLVLIFGFSSGMAVSGFILILTGMFGLLNAYIALAIFDNANINRELLLSSRAISEGNKQNL